MPNQQGSIINLSNLQQSILEQELSRHQVSNQLRLRLRIILEASGGMGNRALARLLGHRSAGVIRKWRNRWASQQSKLNELEIKGNGKRGMKKRLREAILELLSDAEGRGVKPLHSAHQEEQLVALACTNPADHGLANVRWTQKLLAQIAVEKGIFPHISQSKVCIILKKKSCNRINLPTG